MVREQVALLCEAKLKGGVAHMLVTLRHYASRAKFHVLLMGDQRGRCSASI